MGPGREDVFGGAAKNSPCHPYLQQESPRPTAAALLQAALQFVFRLQ